jgi:hypothetical protein
LIGGKWNNEISQVPQGTKENCRPLRDLGKNAHLFPTINCWAIGKRPWRDTKINRIGNRPNNKSLGYWQSSLAGLGKKCSLPNNKLLGYWQSSLAGLGKKCSSFPNNKSLGYWHLSLTGQEDKSLGG